MSGVTSERFAAGLIAALVVVSGSLGGCARLPYTTTTIYESPVVSVHLQREVEPAGYSHPTSFTADQVAAILRGFSIRTQQRLPLRWFAEELPPQRLLRDDEIARVAALLVDGFQQAGSDERVHFAVSAPGMNRADARTVTDGWMAVRDARLYVTIEHVHAEVPVHKSDPYYPGNPQVAPLPGSFLLFFEPGRFWGADQRGVWALDYKDFLKSGVSARPVP